MFLVRLLIDIIVGGLSGFIAGNIMKSEGSLLRNIILGIVGGAVGGILFGLIGLAATGIIGSIIISVVGACLLIYLGQKFLG